VDHWVAWRSRFDQQRPRWILAGVAVAVLAVGAFLLLRPAVAPTPQCGVLRSGPGSSGPESPDTRPLDCFYQAFQQGRLTDVRTVRTTPEGGRITYDLRIAVPGRRILASIDSRDRFFPRGRFHYSCEGMWNVPDAGRAGRSHLTLTGCHDERGFIEGGQIVP
jgi:hypothetical protein